jgi:hypothetical protein
MALMDFILRDALQKLRRPQCWDVENESGPVAIATVKQVHALYEYDDLNTKNVKRVGEIFLGVVCDAPVRVVLRKGGTRIREYHASPGKFHFAGEGDAVYNLVGSPCSEYRLELFRAVRSNDRVRVTYVHGVVCSPQLRRYMATRVSEEVSVRQFSARTICAAAFRCITDPAYTACRSRLEREFAGLST